VKLTAFLIAAFAMTGVCSLAFGFGEPTPAADASASESALAPADIVIETRPFRPVSAWQRLGWFDQKTFGVLTLGGSIPGAAWQTFRDEPRAAAVTGTVSLSVTG